MAPLPGPANPGPEGRSRLAGASAAASPLTSFGRHWPAGADFEGLRLGCDAQQRHRIALPRRLMLGPPRCCGRRCGRFGLDTD